MDPQLGRERVHCCGWDRVSDEGRRWVGDMSCRSGATVVAMRLFSKLASCFEPSEVICYPLCLQSQFVALQSAIVAISIRSHCSFRSSLV